MTINPVEMQVIIPQSGEVGRLHRGLQNQQQTEQQILGQSIQDSLRQQEQSVQKLKPVDQKKVQLGDSEKHHANSKRKEKNKKQQSDAIENDDIVIAAKEKLGNILDIKI